MKVRVLAFALMLVIPSVTSAAEVELQRDKMLRQKRRNRSSHQSNISINACRHEISANLTLVYRLTYNDDVAAGQLAVFQGASDEHI